MSAPFASVIPTLDQIARRYDLRDADTYIASLGVSREAQHLINETLWRLNWGPHRFLHTTPDGRARYIAETAPKVRPSAKVASVVSEAVRAVK